MNRNKYLFEHVQSFLEQKYDLSNSTMSKKEPERQAGSDKTTENWQKGLIKIVLEYVDKPYQDFTEREKWVAAQEAAEEVIQLMKQRMHK